MSSAIPVEHLVLVDELAADPQVRRLLPRRGAVKRYLAQRASNGLDERGVVRVAANGRLLIDRDGFVSWLYGAASNDTEARAS
jgi:hypothetical protein